MFKANLYLILSGHGMLKDILNNPILRMLIGFILLYTSGVEVFRDLMSAESIKVGAHHGVFIYAIFHILDNLPDALEGMSDLTGEK